MDPDEYPGERWRVDGDVLCLVKTSSGDATDALITYDVRIVKEGQQKPAFVRLQWPNR